MADKYIDSREVIEYGRYFLRAVIRLIGLSAVVNIPALQQLVQAVVEAMEAALGVAQTQRSGAKTGRTGVSETAADTLDALRRFNYHLKTLPKSTVYDRDAFFGGFSIDEIARLKPADLLDRADHAARGFGVAANLGLPGIAEWLPLILNARNELAAAIEGKGDAADNDKDAVGSVAEIRERFLNVYNNVAKRSVWAVLAEVGRLDEYNRYFRDLQVNEDGRPIAEPGNPDTEPEKPGAEPGSPAEPAAG